MTPALHRGIILPITTMGILTPVLLAVFLPMDTGSMTCAAMFRNGAGDGRAYPV